MNVNLIGLKQTDIHTQEFIKTPTRHHIGYRENPLVKGRHKALFWKAQSGKGNDGRGFPVMLPDQLLHPDHVAPFSEFVAA